VTHASDKDPGFAVVPKILDRSEVLAIAARLERDVRVRSRAGARHVMSHAVVSDVARDPRLLAIARRLTSADAIPFRATLFDKSPRSNWLVVWHQDTALPLQSRRDVPGWGPWSVKGGITYAHAPAAALSRVMALRLHLDDSRADNGPLRVLPGTHALGVLSDVDVGRLVREIEPVDCVAPAGGVVAMRPLVLHASSKAETDHPRRVLHIEYADSLIVGDGLELALA
jgi:ectoine hydroxylase-related dioxygenase (phytanoyl-CoA dioxygenase family)